MKRLLLVPMLLVACVNGKPGKNGPPGPAGPSGERFVWMDANGQEVPDAYAAWIGNSFSMTVADANGVFFGVNPLDGSVRFDTYSSSQTKYYVTNNCTGPTGIVLWTPPNVAFSF